MLTLVEPWRPIAPGGTVFDIAPDADGSCWLATGAGLWHGRTGAWRPAATQPLARVAAVALAGGAGPLLAGGAGLAYSLDGGASWLAAYADEVEAPVTCLAAGPPEGGQGVVLAGTSGAGVLRSTDGGRSWRTSGAGLEEFVVLALAVAPVWGRHEEALALTTGGLYRSPNGGRYWKRALDADDLALQALAVSPWFGEDRTAYAAGELPGLWRTTDGGRGWHQVPSAGGAAPAGVNCLLALSDGPGALLAGTVEGELWRSGDGGASWERAGAAGGPVLALAAPPGLLLAGALDARLSHAPAGGPWRPEPGLALQDVTRLALDARGAPLAYGPGGLWRAEGEGWRQLLAGDPAAPLTALLPLGGGALLLATPGRLLGLDAAGRAAPMSAPGDAPATAFAQQAQSLWVGDGAGQVWRRAGGAAHWEREATLAAGAPVVGLAPLPDGGLLAATWSARARQMRVWRRAAPGAPWVLWLEAPSPWPRLSVAPGEETLLGIGASLWGWDGAAWAAAEPDGRNVVALCRAPGWEGPLAATEAGLYARDPAVGWRLVGADVPPGGLIDLAALPDGRLLGLGRGGLVGAYAR